MGWTKKQIIDRAFSKIGLATYTYDLSSEQYQEALLELDALVGRWGADGIHIGWPGTTNPDDSALATDTQAPASALDALALGLAIQIAPMYGRQVSPDLRASYASARRTMFQALSALPPEMQFPSSLPRGQGSKPWRYYGGEYFEPTDSVDTGDDSELEFE